MYIWVMDQPNLVYTNNLNVNPIVINCMAFAPIFKNNKTEIFLKIWIVDNKISVHVRLKGVTIHGNIKYRLKVLTLLVNLNYVL